MRLFRPILTALVLSLAAVSASAQVPGGGVTAIGPITPGDCAKWYSPYAIQDSGGACGGGGGGGVTSFNSRTGAVVPTSGDYTFSEIGSAPTTLAGYGITDGVSLTGLQTLTNKTISGASNTLTNIGNGSLTNSSLTIAGHSVSLGGTQALASTDLSDSALLARLASPTFTGTVTFPDAGTWGTGITDTNPASLGNVNVTSSTLPADGIYLSSANVLAIATNSVSRITVGTQTNITGNVVNNSTSGYELAGGAASATVPTLIPNRTSTLYGLGGDGATKVSIIANSTEIEKWLSTGPAIVTVPTDATYTDNTLCRDTTSGAVYTGSGTLGICLGTSSARYKTAIKTIQTIALPKIMALAPSQYRYKPGYGDNGARENYWLIAEQVQKIMPQCVPLDKIGKPSTVDPICVETFMLKGMQEEEKQIANDNQRIAVLEEKLARK